MIPGSRNRPRPPQPPLGLELGRRCMAVIAILATWLASPCFAAAEQCQKCHQALGGKLAEKAIELEGSVHRVIGCAGCHGGDRDDPTAGAHAATLGFAARPPRQRIAELCGGCHGDARFVRRFDPSLPVDQLVLFAASGHGAAVARGDDRAPTCSGCHGVHGIRPVDDPASPVHPGRVAELCGDCHAKPDVSRRGGDPPRGWGDGVHASALAAGVPGAPTCTGCHGGHGQLPGTAATLGQVCGGCHVDQRRAVERSPHDRPFHDRGLGECTPCHGSHRIDRPSARLIGLSAEGACGQCHARDPGIRAATERLRELLTASEAAAGDARERARRARAAGLPVGSLAPLELELRTAEIELRARVHTLTEAELAEPRAAVETAAANLRGRVDSLERGARADRGGHYGALGASGALFLLLAVRALSRRRASRRS